MNNTLPTELYDHAILTVISTEIHGFDRFDMAMNIGKPHSEEALDYLIEKGILREENGLVRSTSLGKRLHRSGGFQTYLDEELAVANANEERAKLEMNHLRQSLKIAKWQFNLMLFGSLGGLISFIILLYQFLMGDGGLIEDIFDRG